MKQEKKYGWVVACDELNLWDGFYTYKSHAKAAMTQWEKTTGLNLALRVEVSDPLLFLDWKLLSDYRV